MESWVGIPGSGLTVELVQVEAAVEADVELGGAFGIAGAGRPGCREIRLDVRIVGDAPAETCAAVLAEATRRSPVLATLTDGVPVVVLLHTEGPPMDPGPALHPEGPRRSPEGPA